MAEDQVARPEIVEGNPDVEPGERIEVLGRDGVGVDERRFGDPGLSSRALKRNLAQDLRHAAGEVGMSQLP